MAKEIDAKLLTDFSVNFDGDRANTVALNSVTKNGILASVQTPDAIRNTTHNFSVRLPKTPVTNQKQSGRCWLFAAANVLRFEIIKKYNLKNFELSLVYLLFWDKLEKANYFLENILDTLDEPLEGRLVAYLLSSPEGDGGQWDMFVSLVEKYGVVPAEAMPENAVSSSTSELRNILTEKLREYACILRNLHSQGHSLEDLRIEKEHFMEEIYRILCIGLGKPPKKFDLEFTDKDGKFTRDAGLTPHEFYEKYIDLNLEDYISLINSPTEDKPYYRSYSVRYLGNVVGGRPVHYVNLPIEKLKDAAVAQLKDGFPVWFGSDVGKHSERKLGLLDTNLYDRESLFNVSFGMNKGQRLDYGQSLMTHAMVLQGVDIDEANLPIRWCVENSWGDDKGSEGYFSMGDNWFDEYVYQIVINKKYLEAEVLKAYESEPILLEPWDPMGSLA